MAAGNPRGWRRFFHLFGSSAGFYFNGVLQPVLALQFLLFSSAEGAQILGCALVVATLFQWKIVLNHTLRTKAARQRGWKLRILNSCLTLIRVKKGRVPMKDECRVTPTYQENLSDEDNLENFLTFFDEERMRRNKARWKKISDWYSRFKKS